jgi:carboxypeptidase C (cathepsin A)
VIKKLGDYQPCEDNWVVEYLNRADVQTAIHAKPTVWSECSYTLEYSESDSLNPMEPYYQYLIDGGYNLNILVYSGDDDSVCATSGSQDWIYNLGYKITNNWKSWMYTDDTFGDQLGGYVIQFAGFNFATIHGAGHEVPTYKQQAALEVFKKYLSGIW